MRAEGERSKTGRAQSATNRKEINIFLSNHIDWLSRKRALLSTIISSTLRGPYRWYVVTYHVYKRVSPVIAGRLSKLSFLTDKLRKSFRHVRREFGARGTYILYNIEKDNLGVKHRVADVIDLGKSWLRQPAYYSPRLCFTVEKTEDGLNHYHGFIGLPMDDHNRVQSLRHIKNYYLWTDQVDQIDFDYLKYIFKYNHCIKYQDYFFE